ncbi:MAG TPA: hypothetical protein VGH33_24730 [Isosphaeraceae bacterium]
MTKRSLTVAVVGLGALMASAAFSTTDLRERTAERLARRASSSIEPLDRCIQYRLHNLEGFGISRLMDVPQHLYRFTPETPDEASAVSGLRWSGTAVAIYLGGLGLLDRARDTGKEPLGFRAFSPAIDVTGTATLDPPPASALRALGRKALAASPAGEPVTGTVGRWRIDVRPVRADRQDCIDCHDSRRPDLYPRLPGRPDRRPLGIGDALGVVVYASTDR